MFDDDVDDDDDDDDDDGGSGSGSHISAKRHRLVVCIVEHERNKPTFGLETFNLNRQDKLLSMSIMVTRLS